MLWGSGSRTCSRGREHATDVDARIPGSARLWRAGGVYPLRLSRASPSRAWRGRGDSRGIRATRCGIPARWATLPLRPTSTSALRTHCRSPLPTPCAPCRCRREQSDLSTGADKRMRRRTSAQGAARQALAAGRCAVTGPANRLLSTGRPHWPDRSDRTTLPPTAAAQRNRLRQLTLRSAAIRSRGPRATMLGAPGAPPSATVDFHFRAQLNYGQSEPA